jgi:hypothetical protein
MSRNEQELQKRVDLLVKALEKEQTELKDNPRQQQLQKQSSMSTNPL